MKNIKEKYRLAKESKIGENCICPSCGAGFKKTNYQQAFCKTKGKTVCKDKYWNTVIPEKRNNKTRISPASAQWMANQREDANMSKKKRPEAWQIWGVWHDDDWSEHDGGSGGV